MTKTGHRARYVLTERSSTYRRTPAGTFARVVTLLDRETGTHVRALVDEHARRIVGAA